MSTTKMPAPPTPTESDGMSKLIKQYGCGPIQAAGCRITDLKAIILLTDGLVQCLPSRDLGRLYSLMCPQCFAGHETEVTR